MLLPEESWLDHGRWASKTQAECAHWACQTEWLQFYVLHPPDFSKSSSGLGLLWPDPEVVHTTDWCHSRQLEAVSPPFETWPHCDHFD